MSTNAVFKNKIVTARKEHDCSACEMISNGDNPEDWMEVDELIVYLKVKEKGFKINPGDRYIFQTGVYDGELYTYRAIPEIHDICVKYDIFGD